MQNILVEKTLTKFIGTVYSDKVDSDLADKFFTNCKLIKTAHKTQVFHQETFVLALNDNSFGKSVIYRTKGKRGKTSMWKIGILLSFDADTRTFTVIDKAMKTFNSSIVFPYDMYKDYVKTTNLPISTSTIYL